MVKLYPIVGAVLSLTALIILSVGASTNRWIVVDHTEDDLNPIVVNSELGEPEARLGMTSYTSKISYSVSHFGLWISCHREHKGAVSCSFIRSSCKSNVCWIRVTSVSRTMTCLDKRVKTISGCALFQVVRLFIVVGGLLLILGVCTQVVSLILVKRSLAMLAGLVLFAATICVIIGFAIFYSELFLKNGLSDIAHRGYSLTLIIITFPMTLVGALISCFAASMGLRHKEVSDYSASNY